MPAEPDRKNQPLTTASSTGALQVGKGPTAPGSTPSIPGEALPLPHERDQAVGSAGEAAREPMKQAQRDLDAGLVDTDLRATAGLDADQRRRLVPGPGGTPPGKG